MELFKLFVETGILALLIMFAGWAFVYANSRALARQSEANAIAVQIDKTLQEIADENYKFWQGYEAGANADEHLAKCRFFSAYVEHRCNVVEKKIQILSNKCSTEFNVAVLKLNFSEKSVKLLSDIRDRATINSEGVELVRERYSRISAVNTLSVKLSMEVSEFIRVRFMPMSEWKWPDNY
jgi:hypothetical protein